MDHQEMNGQGEVTLLGAPEWVTRSQERAHAMKNRMAAIRALARLAGRYAPPTAPDLPRRLDEIVGELAALVDDVVDDAVRGSQHHDTASLPPVDVPGLFEVVAARLGARASARGVHLRFECAPATVHGVACDLGEAVYNLVSNALDATPPGGVVTVLTRVTERGEHAWTVEDSGCGIPREVLASVSTHRCSRRSGGTGLGLAIAAATIGRHGGMLEASATHGGTRMTARLPAALVP